MLGSPELAWRELGAKYQGGPNIWAWIDRIMNVGMWTFNNAANLAQLPEHLARSTVFDEYVKAHDRRAEFFSRQYQETKQEEVKP